MGEVQNVAIHSQSALSGLQRSVREGASLFVRILQNQGGGRYLASFAGGRFLVKSDAALKAGDTFRARVRVANGKIFLLPQNGGGKILGANAISVQNFSFQSHEVSAFLASFGLPADCVSQKILQFLMQSGARLDLALMKKVRRLAAKFGGREIEAAESALILEQKGFDSEDFLEEIMELLGGDFQGRERKNSGERNSREGKSKENLNENLGDGNSNGNPAEKKFIGEDSLNDGAISENATFQNHSDLESDSENFLRQFLPQCAEEIKRFFSFALGGDFQSGEKNDSDFQDSNLRNSDFQNSKSGANGFFRGEDFEKNFLAFFNHKALKSQGKKNWIFLPFEFEMNSLRKDDGSVFRGAGVFRIFLDLEKNLAEKVAVNFKFAGKNLFFVIYFKDKKVRRVHFSLEGFEEKSATENLAKEFGEGVEVREISSEEFSSYGTEDFPLPSVEGFA